MDEIKTLEYFYLEHYMKFAKPFEKKMGGVFGIVVLIIWMFVKSNVDLLHKEK